MLVVVDRRTFIALMGSLSALEPPLDILLAIDDDGLEDEEVVAWGEVVGLPRFDLTMLELQFRSVLTETLSSDDRWVRRGHEEKPSLNLVKFATRQKLAVGQRRIVLRLGVKGWKRIVQIDGIISDEYFDTDSGRWVYDVRGTPKSKVVYIEQDK